MFGAADAHIEREPDSMGNSSGSGGTGDPRGLGDRDISENRPKNQERPESDIVHSPEAPPVRTLRSPDQPSSIDIYI